MSERTHVEVGGRRLALSNLDKVLYLQTGYTKAAVIDYYVRVAPALLPHLTGRPLTLLRYPDGVDGNRFFEKNCPDHRPDWMGTVRLEQDKVTDHCAVTDAAGLAWVANLAALELHTSLARLPDTRMPTMVVFDLDPGAPAGLLECAQVALWLREVFDRLGLVSCVKTSGSKGMQVYVPVNRPTSYDETRPWSQAVAQLIERVHGDAVVTTMTKAVRAGKVYIDWAQNHVIKSTVCAYSLRARDRPTVSTPLTWNEVAAACDAEDPGTLTFEADDVLARVARHGELFAPTVDVAQELPALA